MSENGWSEDRKLVFSELERLGKGVDLLAATMADIRVDIARLQVKAAVYGGGAGIVIGVVASLLNNLGN